MSKILFIVESPGKIKKIQSILGSDYIVDASIGHVLDIPSDNMNIDVKNNFEPTFKIKLGYNKKVKELKDKYKICKNVILAMDEDREGEAIANGLVIAMKLKKGTYKRVVFNEITKKGIMKGIENPRDIDYNLVNAQKARMVLDKYIGYSLTPCVWKAIMPKLSAGRVQSIVNKIIVEKENEIKEFLDKSFYKTTGYFENDIEGILKNELKENEIKEFLEKCLESKFSIGDIIKKESIRNPPPPFITSSLQQEASNKFGMTPKITMSIAQKLYEKGHITYMRTDSTSLSDDAIKDINKYIVNKWGKELYKNRKYESKVKNAQEAHEAIRPTKIDKEIVGETDQEKKLYSLIWKRTVASQMESAKYDVYIINILISEIKKNYFESKIENLIFCGYLTIYDTKINNVEIKIKKGEKIEMKKIESKQEYKKPPSRFNEANLIKFLEKNGIGRPSTYASMIDKVLKKDYAIISNIEGIKKKSNIYVLEKNKIKNKQKDIVIGKENKKLVPTPLGIKVNEYLVDKFDKIMEYKFTANMEDELDDISNGNKIWYNVLNNFNNTFEPILKIELNKENKEINLGKDTQTGYKIIATTGPYGDYVKLCGSTKKECKSVSVENMNNITLEQAIKLFEYPLELGKYENKIIYIKKGKYGKYIEWNKNNYSMGDTDNIDIDAAIQIINKNKQNYVIQIKDKKTLYTILEGQYGPYINIKYGKTTKNVSLKMYKGDIKDIVLDDIKKIIEKKKD